MGYFLKFIYLPFLSLTKEKLTVQRIILIHIFLFSIFFSKFCLSQVDVVAERSFEIVKEQNRLLLPYYTTHSFESIDLEVRKVIVVIHGTNRNADDYFDNMKAALSRRQNLIESTAIIAPQFLTEEDIEVNILSEDYIYWSFS